MKRIAIHSVPRSGSTWLGNIFNSNSHLAFRYQPLFSYAFKNALNEKSSKQEIINFFNKIKNSNDDFINQTDGIKRGTIPDFKKNNITHICYKEVRYHNLLTNLIKTDDEMRVIGLVRNPLAVINSWLNAPKEFKKELEWKIEDEWRFAPRKNLNKKEEFHGFEKWIEVTHVFLNLQTKYPDRFYLLNYSDLLEKKQQITKGLFDFCELNMEPQTIDFLEISNKKENQDAYSVFKKKTNDNAWQDSLPKYIINEVIEDKNFQELNTKFQWV